MKVALPVAREQLCLHFGHCEKFCFYEVDPDAKKIIKTEIMDAPPHEPGLLPKVLGEKGVNVVISGGMGMRAQQLFNQNGIKVVTGVDPSGGSLEEIVTAYLNGSLQTGANPCSH